MNDCLAGIERGDFIASRAATLASAAGCPFCIARCRELPGGEQFVVLSGYAAGEVVSSHNRLLNRNTELYAALPIDPLPNWLTPFSLRTLFILDELAVWFCNAALIGEGFAWERTHILTVAGVCWDKRIACSGSEMGRTFLAHGMPDRRLDEFGEQFDFAVAAMIAARGRRPVKNRRDPLIAAQQWAAAMRQWGRQGP